MVKKNILVVEDSELLLMALRDVLEVEGYEVVTAGDGVEALEVMQENVPDLIIADISMPRMDGYRFFKEVRARPQWVPIPFIFLTARAEREDRLRGKALGAEDYLIKPFDPQELVVVVRSRIGRAQAIQQWEKDRFEELKEQIVTLLSHELRTPLTSVYGYTELALEDAAALPASEFQHYLMGIKRGADRLTRLVEDLLMVVRQDTGQLEKEFRLLGEVESDVGEVLRKAVQAQQIEASSNDIELVADIPSDLPPVRVYTYFLKEAVGRLIDNALKFSRSKGERVIITASADDDWLEISVSDEGVGIPEEKLHHLFERFSQIDRDIMEQQGAGLGLVIAQGLVQSMDGQIAVESEFGQGSTFTIRLPVIEPAA
jgi:signal transduction histidine kinase